jgi:hypothetical protein
MSTSLQLYTNKTFIERIKRDINNGFPDTDFSMSDNEILFHIDQAKAAALIGNVYGAAKVEGALAMPEAWITTYTITNLRKNEATSEWYGDLPQPPVSLPLGYSIADVYFATSAEGDRQSLFPVDAKQVPMMSMLPQPAGSRYWVRGKTIYAKAWNGASLLGKSLYVEMAKTRTINLTDELGIPDDQVEVVYNLVMDKLKKRIMNPQDIIQDNLPAGNKSS